MGQKLLIDDFRNKLQVMFITNSSFFANLSTDDKYYHETASMKNNIVLFLAFGIFGLSIGTIVGLTDAQITTTLVALMFGFAGGKMFLSLDEKPPAKQIQIGLILLGFSIFFLGGTFFGLDYKFKYTQKLRADIRKNGVISAKDSIAASYNTLLHARITNYHNYADRVESDLRAEKIKCDEAVNILLDSIRMRP